MCARRVSARVAAIAVVAAAIAISDHSACVDERWRIISRHPSPTRGEARIVCEAHARPRETRRARSSENHVSERASKRARISRCHRARAPAITMSQEAASLSNAVIVCVCARAVFSRFLRRADRQSSARCCASNDQRVDAASFDSNDCKPSLAGHTFDSRNPLSSTAHDARRTGRGNARFVCVARVTRLTARFVVVVGDTPAAQRDVALCKLRQPLALDRGSRRHCAIRKCSSSSSSVEASCCAIESADFIACRRFCRCTRRSADGRLCCFSRV